MGGIEQSPQARKRAAKRRKTQEARWAAKAGPVEIRQATPPDDARQDLPGAAEGR